MATKELKAPYWITKNEHEAVAVGLKQSLNKWQLVAIQYFRQRAKDDWVPAAKAIRLNTNLYSELVSGIVRLKDYLSEPGQVYTIRKTVQEELRIYIREILGQNYIVFCNYIRDLSDDGETNWVAIGEEVSLPTSKHDELLEVLRKMGLGLELLRKEESIKKSRNFQKPHGRNQYYIDERGFLVSKQQWDELHANL